MYVYICMHTIFRIAFHPLLLIPSKHAREHSIALNTNYLLHIFYKCVYYIYTTIARKKSIYIYICSPSSGSPLIHSFSSPPNTHEITAMSSYSMKLSLLVYTHRHRHTQTHTDTSTHTRTHAHTHAHTRNKSQQ